MKYAIPMAMIVAGLICSIVVPLTNPASLLSILASSGLALLVTHDTLFRLLHRWFHRDIALAYAATPMLVVEIINERMVFGVGGALFVSGVIYTSGIIDDFLELEDNYLENKLAEAISELEEAMRKPTCEGCSNLDDIGKSYKYCKELCINISHSTESTFYCNRYEAKESKC